jgi:catechol 2,3-dioxygenase-like lactoylglutathione lyase family enzyme
MNSGAPGGPVCMGLQTNLSHVGTFVLPVSDQERALEFYTEVLGCKKVNDFTYETGERWLEVQPDGGGANLCLVLARPERPAGAETGIVLLSTDVTADLAALRSAGIDTDPEPLAEGRVVWWSGAPLAGRPPQFRLRDPDGNSLLVVAAT